MTDPTPPTPPADPAPPAPNPSPPVPTPPANGPAPKQDDPPADTDWKAESRKWEKLAKENKNAATELDKLRKQHMTEQEKAVADAEAKGRTAAATEYGTKLAAAEFRAAAAAAGVKLGDAADLIDTSKFLTDTGEVDTGAIKKAVDKLAKLAPAAGPARSGGDHPGGGGTPTTRPTSLSAAVKKSLGGG